MDLGDYQCIQCGEISFSPVNEKDDTEVVCDSCGKKYKLISSKKDIKTKTGIKDE